MSSAESRTVSGSVGQWPRRLRPVHRCRGGRPPSSRPGAPASGRL